MKLRDRLAASVRSHLARRGIVAGRVPSANRLDHALVRVLSSRGVDYVLDVGAHTGEFGRFLRTQCGWKGPICSFEPVHSSFVDLTGAMQKDPGWHGYEVALGAAPQRSSIRHFSQGSNFDSLRAPSEYGRDRFAVLASPFTEENVRVQRLDDVVDDVLTLAPGKAMLLKIDTQGFDLEVLRGSTGCLDRVVSVQLELSAHALYEGLPGFGVAIQEVMDHGFHPVGFYPVYRDPDLQVAEFDGLFARGS